MDDTPTEPILKTWEHSVGIGLGHRVPNATLEVANDFMVQTAYITKDIYIQGVRMRLPAEWQTDSNATTVTLYSNVPMSFIELGQPSNSQQAWVASATGTGREYAMDVHVCSGRGNDTILSVINSATSGTSFACSNPYGGIYQATAPIINQGITSFGIISAYAPSGASLWQRMIGSSNGDCVLRVVRSDNAGNIYVCGWLTNSDGAFLYTEDETSPHTIKIAPGNAGLVVKYDRSGEPQWVCWITSADSSVHTDDARAYTIAVDSLNNRLYVGGTVSSTNATLSSGITIIDGNGNTSTTAFPAIQDGAHGFLAQFNMTDGSFQWANFVDGVGADAFMCAAFSAGDNTVVAGASSDYGDRTFYSQNPHSNIIIYDRSPQGIVKYDGDGNAQWAAFIDDDAGNGNGIFNVATNSNSDIFVVGEYEGSVLYVKDSFGNRTTLQSPIIQGANVATTGVRNCLLKFSRNGQYQWGCTFACSNSEVPNAPPLSMQVRGLDVDIHGNAYISTVANQVSRVMVRNANNDIIIAANQDVTPNAHIMKFSSDGVFQMRLASLAAASSAHIRNIALDKYGQAYAAGFGSGDIRIKNINNTSNFYQQDALVTGVVFGITMDGFMRNTGVPIIVPKHYFTGFKKDLYINAQNVPCVANIYTEGKDGTYTIQPLLIGASNFTYRSGWVWANNGKWLDETYYTTGGGIISPNGTNVSGAGVILPVVSLGQGVRHYSYYFGDFPFDTLGTHYIGTTIAWMNTTLDSKLAFRVTAKCTLFSENDIGYRYFETIVSPVNDEGQEKPKGIMTPVLYDAITDQEDIKDVHHSVSRHRRNAVNLVVSWQQMSPAPVMATIEVQVLASVRLGNFLIVPFYG